MKKILSLLLCLALSQAQAAQWLPLFVPPAPTADLQFANGAYFGCTATSCLTNTNAAGGYCTDSSGVLHLIPANTLRICSGTGLLVENNQALLLASQGLFSNVSNWSPTNTIATDNTTAAPDGTLTGSGLVDNTTSGLHDTAAAQTLSYINATSYTVSVFLKANTASSAQLTFPSGAFSGVGYANFNLSTCAVATTGGTLNGSGTISLANGWCRCWISANATASSVQQVSFFLNNNNTSAARAPSYSGTGLGVFIWGVGVEVGVSPSSYIPTVASTVTRFDNIVISSILASTLAASMGTIVANTNAARQSIAATIIDSNGTVLLGKTTGNLGTTAVGATLSTGNTGTWTGANDLGLAWNALGGALQLNGGTIATDATARTPSATFHLGSTSGLSAFFNGYITRLTAYSIKQSSPQ